MKKNHGLKHLKNTDLKCNRFLCVVTTTRQDLHVRPMKMRIGDCVYQKKSLYTVTSVIAKARRKKFFKNT